MHGSHLIIHTDLAFSAFTAQAVLAKSYERQAISKQIFSDSATPLPQNY